MRKLMLLTVLALFSVALINCGGGNSSGGWTELAVPSDPNFLFAFGSGESATLQLALDKAIAAARTEVGRQMTIKLNSLQKIYAEEIGAGEDSELRSMYESVTKTIVSQELYGSKVKEQKYRQRSGRYEAQVVMEYPIGAANAALANQIKANNNMYTRFRASEGFKELESEVDKYEEWKKQQGR